MAIETSGAVTVAQGFTITNAQGTTRRGVLVIFTWTPSPKLQMGHASMEPTTLIVADPFELGSVGRCHDYGRLHRV